MNEQDIKRFVREVLGCECPEEVFEKIECKNRVKLSGTLFLRHEINIGDRLLIYVLDFDSIELLHSSLPLAVNLGRQHRDNKGFNRLRVVLLSSKPNEIEAHANTIFKTLDTDEKIHLHIIQAGDFPQGGMGQKA